MKILMVARRYPPDVQSGTETVFSSLYAQSLASPARHSVRLLAGFRQSRDLLPPEAVPVDLRAGGASAWLRMAAATRAEAARFRPDAVLANSIEAVAPGFPTFILVHDLNFGQAARSPASRLREAFYRLRARDARLIAVSAATRDRLLSIGVPPDRVHTIHNGVDLDRLQPQPPPPGPLTFILVSRVLPGKGQHVAIDALGRMRPDQRKNFRLLIVGAKADPRYADQLRVQSYKLPVEFHFDVPDIALFYRQAHIALFPTCMEEGFGYGAVEAMSAGLPVIWSDQPAVREATGGIGIPVPMDDAEQLRNAMLKLASDAQRRAEIGGEGRRFVEQYRWETVWKKYEDIMTK